jgi:tRNA pseudouridine32 synthase/23S rRNA pseudouridine746 synthase
MIATAPSKFKFSRVAQAGEEVPLVDFLKTHSPLSKERLKRALNSGAVWMRKKHGRPMLIRVRRAQTVVIPGDLVELYYDESILSHEGVAPTLIKAGKEWGLWFKPAGLLSQGTKYGDHCSLERFIAKEKGACHLVHRLDREAQGLIVVAYTPKAAAMLSREWQDQRVIKTYRAKVIGQPAEEGTIVLPIDGKDAITTYKRLETNGDVSLLELQIKTGRLHQIRRHLEAIGYPVLGDPTYGKANKDPRGLHLVAYSVKFKDPMTREIVNVELPEAFRPF